MLDAWFETACAGTPNDLSETAYKPVVENLQAVSIFGTQMPRPTAI